MKIWPIVLVALLPSLAGAQQGIQNFPNGQLPPKTVWQIDNNGMAMNPQSRLECPAEAGEFHRVSLQIFNPFGTDVSCNYQNINRDLISFYIALRGNRQTLGQEFENGKRAILQRTPSPVPLADAEQQTFMSDIDWRHFIYRANGATRTGIWMTRFGGWNVEFRATYAESRSDATFAAMSTLSAVGQKTAGEHIAACFAMMPVMRNGQLIRNEQILTTLTLAATLQAQAPPRSSPNWCVQQPLTINGARWLMWRNADQSGGAADRLTSVDNVNAPVIYSATDSRWQALWKEGDEKPKAPYDIVIEAPNAIDLAGLYDGRPTIQQLANVTRAGVPLYAHFDKAAKKMTIYRAPLPAVDGAAPPVDGAVPPAVDGAVP